MRQLATLYIILFVTLKRTNEKKVYAAFEHHLVTSCSLRMNKSEIFTFLDVKKLRKCYIFNKNKLKTSEFEQYTRSF